MYILSHFDWFGPIEELEEIDKKLKKFYDGKDGVEFLGRFAPHNHKYHWTRFFWAKDFKTWFNRKEPSPPFYKRDYNVMTYAEADYYE